MQTSVATRDSTDVSSEALLAALEEYMIAESTKASTKASLLFFKVKDNSDRLLDSAFRLFATTNGVSAEALLDMLNDDHKPDTTKIKAAVLLFENYIPRPTHITGPVDKWLHCLCLMHERDVFRRSQHCSESTHELMLYTISHMQWPPPVDAQTCLVNWLRNCHRFFDEGLYGELGSGGLPILPKDVSAQSKEIYTPNANRNNGTSMICPGCQANPTSMEACKAYLEHPDVLYTNTSAVEKVTRKILQKVIRSVIPIDNIGCTCGIHSSSHASRTWRVALSCYATMQYEAFSIDATGIYRGLFTSDLRSLPLRSVLTFLAASSGNRAAARLLPAFIDLLLYLCPDALLDTETLGVVQNIHVVDLTEPGEVRGYPSPNPTPADISDHILPRMLALRRDDKPDSCQTLWRAWRDLVRSHLTPQYMMLLTANWLLGGAARQRGGFPTPTLASFDVLEKEPFILLRLPESVLTNPAVLRVVIHITKAATTASRQSVRIAARLASQRASQRGGGMDTPLSEGTYLEVQEVITGRLFLCLLEREVSKQGSADSWWVRDAEESIHGFLEWLLNSNELLPARQLYRSLLRHGLSEPAFRLLTCRAGTAPPLEALLLETVSRDCDGEISLSAYETIILHLQYQLTYRSGHSVTAKIAERLPFYLYDNFRAFNNYLKEGDTDGIVDITRNILRRLADSVYASIALPELVRIVAIPVKKGQSGDKRLVRKYLETAKELIAARDVALAAAAPAGIISGVVASTSKSSKPPRPAADLAEDWKLMQKAVTKPSYTNVSKAAVAKITKATVAGSGNTITGSKTAAQGGANKRKYSDKE